MSENNGNNWSVVSVIISVSSLLLAAGALYFSWEANQLSVEANQIAQQGNSPIVEIGSTRRIQVDYGKTYPSLGGYEVGCSYEIDISNLGGAATAVVDYETRLFLQDNGNDLEVTASMNDPGQMRPPVYNIFSFLLTAGTESWGSHFSDIFSNQKYRVPIPMPIPAYSTVSVVHRVSGFVDPSHELALNQANQEGEVSLLDVEHIYHLSNGEQLSTGRMNCIVED